MQTECIGAIAVVLLCAACSTSDNQQPATQPETDASSEQQADASPPDVTPSDQTSEPQPEAAPDAQEEPCVPVDYTPTPEQIGFKAVNPMPSGE